MKNLGRSILAFITGAVAAGLAAGAAVVGHHVAPAASLTASAPVSEPKDTISTLVCDGGISRTIQGGIDVEQVEENITGWAGALSGQEVIFTPEGTDGAHSFEGVLPAQVLGESALGVPQIIGTLEVEGGIVAGASTHSASAGDLHSVAVSPCQWPAHSMWLVGGSSELGSSLELKVTNPGPTQVSVSLSGYSSRGRLDLGSNAMIHLAPQSSQAILLDGLLAADSRIALHLFSKTAPFTASLQSSALEGARPAGVDVITASNIGTDLVIPGLVIDGDSDSRDGGLLPDSGTTAALRVVNPNTESAQITISVLTADGSAPLPGGTQVQIAPETVLDLSLDGLSAQSHAIRVESTADVSAAVSVARADEAGRDIAWLPAQEAIMQTGAAAFGPLPARLVLAGTAQARWQAFDESGVQLGENTINVDTLGTVDLPAHTAFVAVSSDAEVYGAIWIADHNGIASVPLTEDSSTSQVVRITVQN